MRTLRERNWFTSIAVCEKNMVTLEWIASPVNDMYADAVLSAVLQAESIETPPR